eukprot:CAMPEP_0178986004 /NCGR_PEP_ID=MMETSP0795-20121207/2462_1 /TAXON_ID=88552 /ORGANISM="Amoebophrya sp., Strain Ameob2" /LENGTH=596 /DNA_ID=CAMNT_0020677015 /DNA_START=1249 /DNA_END=3037 /DNA_ORIENTATION=+
MGSETKMRGATIKNAKRCSNRKRRSCILFSSTGFFGELVVSLLSTVGVEMTEVTELTVNYHGETRDHDHSGEVGVHDHEEDVFADETTTAEEAPAFQPLPKAVAKTRKVSKIKQHPRRPDRRGGGQRSSLRGGREQTQTSKLVEDEREVMIGRRADAEFNNGVLEGRVPGGLRSAAEVAPAPDVFEAPVHQKNIVGEDEQAANSMNSTSQLLELRTQQQLRASVPMPPPQNSCACFPRIVLGCANDNSCCWAACCAAGVRPRFAYPTDQGGALGKWMLPTGQTGCAYTCRGSFAPWTACINGKTTSTFVLLPWGTLFLDGQMGVYGDNPGTAPVKMGGWREKPCAHVLQWVQKGTWMSHPELFDPQVRPQYQPPAIPATSYPTPGAAAFIPCGPNPAYCSNLIAEAPCAIPPNPQPPLPPPPHKSCEVDENKYEYDDGCPFCSDTLPVYGRRRPSIVALHDDTVEKCQKDHPWEKYNCADEEEIKPCVCVLSDDSSEEPWDEPEVKCPPCGVGKKGKHRRRILHLGKHTEQECNDKFNPLTEFDCPDLKPCVRKLRSSTTKSSTWFGFGSLSVFLLVVGGGVFGCLLLVGVAVFGW